MAKKGFFIYDYSTYAIYHRCPKSLKKIFYL
nr:MAG TPA: hypothetical protein [Caudoviricetes sp.]